MGVWLSVFKENFLEEAGLGLGRTWIEDGRRARRRGLHVHRQGGGKGRGQGEPSLSCVLLPVV